MKKLALSIMALAIAFTTTIAQDKPANAKASKEFKHKGPKKGHKGQFENKLNLSEAQQAQMKAQQESFRKQMQELKNSNLSEEQKKEARKEMMTAHKAQREALLTAEQKQKAQELRKNRGEGKKGGHGKGKFKGQGIDEKLGLTADQSSKIKAINQTFRGDMKAIRENESLSQEQKKAQMQTLQQKHKNDIRSLLTTDQQQLLKDRLKNRPTRKAVK